MAAEALGGHDVVVGVDEAADLALGVGAGERRAGDADRGVGGGPGDRVPPVGPGRAVRRRGEGRGDQGEQCGDQGGDPAADGEALCVGTTWVGESRHVHPSSGWRADDADDARPRHGAPPGRAVMSCVLGGSRIATVGFFVNSRGTTPVPIPAGPGRAHRRGPRRGHRRGPTLGLNGGAQWSGSALGRARRSVRRCPAGRAPRPGRGPRRSARDG